MRLREIWARLRALRGSDALEREMDEELRFHLEMATERNRRLGMPEEEARRQALIAFGGVERHKEAARDETRPRPLEDLWTDVRYATRALRRAPGFTLVGVLTLALGIGAGTTVFSVVRGLLLRPLPYADPGRLVAVRESHPRDGTTDAPVSAADFLDWRRLDSSFEGLAAYRYWGFVLSGDGEPERVLGARASADLFPLLGVHPLRGRAFDPDEERFGGPRVVLIGEGLWRRRWGAAPDLVGRTVTLDDEPYTVVGIVPSTPLLPDAELWVPLALAPYAAAQRGDRALSVVGRLRPGVTLARADAEMAETSRVLAREHPDADEGWRATVVPLHERLTGEARLPLLLLFGAVGAVLLIACANLAHLFLARAAARGHEIALRFALGARRSRVVRQLLAEALLPALLGGGLGVALAEVGTRVLPRLRPPGPGWSGDVRVDGVVLLFALLLALATGVAVGLVPALHASGVELSGALRAGAARLVSHRAGSRLRSSIAVLDVALACLLSVGAGLLLRSFVGIHAVELGFSPAGVLSMTVSLPDDRYPDGARRTAFFDELRRRVAGLPGVRSVALASHLPLGANPLRTDYQADDAPASAAADRSARLVAVSEDYFAAAGIPLVAGRAFERSDDAGTDPVVVVNQALARRLWPGESAVGRRLRAGATIGADPRPREVVGVVGDTRADRIEEEPGPAIYVPYRQNAWPTMSLVVRAAGDPARLTAAIRAEVLAADPLLPVYDVRTFTEIVDRSLGLRRTLLLLLGAFAALAVLLAAIGVYAVTAYGVVQRIPELGIRAALGATRRDLVRLLLGRTAAEVGAGALVGAACAVAASQLLRRLLYGVAPWDPLTLAGVVVLLSLVGGLAGYLPARRAARADAAAAIRGS